MTFWREVVIGLLAVALLGMGKLYTSEVRSHAATVAERDANLKMAANLRQAVLTRSRIALDTLKVEHKANLERVERHAWKNYVARYGLPAACPVRVQPQPDLPSGGTNLADSAEAPDGTSTERLALVVTDCAHDAATVLEWQRWAELNLIPVE